MSDDNITPRMKAEYPFILPYKKHLEAKGCTGDCADYQMNLLNDLTTKGPMSTGSKVGLTAVLSSFAGPIGLGFGLMLSINSDYENKMLEAHKKYVTFENNISY